MKTARVVFLTAAVVVLTVNPVFGGFEKFLISASGKSEVAVSGNNVIWLAGSNLYGYNLKEKEEFLICNSVRGRPFEGMPEVGLNTAVWVDERNFTPNEDAAKENYDIYGFDLISKEEFPIATTENWKEDGPDISGNIVVWRAGRYSVEGLNLSTGERFTPSPRSCGTRQHPRIDGDTVIWSRYEGDHTPIYIQNLTTGDTTTFTCDSYDFWRSLDIGGDIIVWEDIRDSDVNSQKDIYGYNLSTEEEFPISVSEVWEEGPQVSDNFVVWRAWDPETHKQGIYGYDLDSSTKFIIAEGEEYFSNLAIDSNLVVWSEVDGIYGAYIPEPATLSLLITSAALLLIKKRQVK